MTSPIVDLRALIAVAGGPTAIARQCGLSVPAVCKWIRNGRLPRTEYTGETNYAALIAAACRAKDPATQITRETLLGLARSAQPAIGATSAHA